MVPLLFKRAMVLPLAGEPRAVLALAVLLSGFTFAFLTGVWLVRSLRELSPLR